MRVASRLLAGCVMLLAAAAAGAAETPLQLEWEQLIPVDQRLGEVPSGIVPHGGLGPQQWPPAADDQRDLRTQILDSVVTDYNGKRVKLPGFMVPMSLDGTEVTEFLLVPYFGACIHVPPPPPNQIVYVSADKAVAMAGLFEPVWVTGVMSTAALRTELAEIGYTIEADTVEPYRN